MPSGLSGIFSLAGKIYPSLVVRQAHHEGDLGIVQVVWKFEIVSTLETGEKEVQELMQELGVSPDALIEWAYADLLNADGLLSGKTR